MLKTLEYSKSARRDFRTYAIFFLGLIFTLGGATVDPSKNCDESGRECAPWLVPIAFCVGVITAAAGAGLFIGNAQWGSRIDIVQKKLFWWNSRLSAEVRSISLDDVAQIKVKRGGDSGDSIFLYNQKGVLMKFPKDEHIPYPYAAWAHGLIEHFKHIQLEVIDD